MSKWHFFITLSCCGKLADNRNNTTIFVNETGQVKVETWKGQGGFGKNSETNYVSSISPERAAHFKDLIDKFDFKKIKLKKTYPLDMPFVTVQFPTSSNKPELWHSSVDEAYGDKELNKILDEFVKLVNDIIEENNKQQL